MFAETLIVTVDIWDTAATLCLAIRAYQLAAVHVDHPRRQLCGRSKYALCSLSPSNGVTEQCYAHPNPDHARPFDIDMARASKLAELEGRRDEPYRRLTTLKLWPAAHEMPLLEHVVLTALIVERWRMSEGAVSKLKAALGGLIAGTFGREPR
jgi:hypothetical protein